MWLERINLFRIFGFIECFYSKVQLIQMEIVHYEKITNEHTHYLFTIL